MIRRSNLTPPWSPQDEEKKGKEKPAAKSAAKPAAKSAAKPAAAKPAAAKRPRGRPPKNPKKVRALWHYHYYPRFMALSLLSALMAAWEEGASINWKLISCTHPVLLHLAGGDEGGG